MYLFVAGGLRAFDGTFFTDVREELFMGKNFNVNRMNDFDVFPKVFAVGRETGIHIRALGGRIVFEAGKEYVLTVCAMENGDDVHWPHMNRFVSRVVTADGENGFTFSHTFPSEQMYLLRFADTEGNFLYQFSVYAVEGDLIGRYPFRGDTHMHSTCSDGRQIPEVVISNYRAHGLDFCAITDHRRYYPSLIAMAFAEKVATEMCVCPGEEIHLRATEDGKNDPHIINFGGEYSINAMFPSDHIDDVGDDPALRSLYGECPATMNAEEMNAFIKELCAKKQYPEGLELYNTAVSEWIFSEIRKANGLGIFVHPNWISDVYHMPEAFMDYFVENKLFDAFEVLGGESYYEQNGLQTHRWYSDVARGHFYPVVGATDTHSSYDTNPNAFIASTIVFARENERRELIQSIKDGYSVAVDTISKEYRLVGELRLAKYATFLMNDYYPLHDALCFEEGRLMRRAAVGTEEEKREAKENLKFIYGRVAKQRKKYFAF